MMRFQRESNHTSQSPGVTKTLGGKAQGGGQRTRISSKGGTSHEKNADLGGKGEGGWELQRRGYKLIGKDCPPTSLLRRKKNYFKKGKDDPGKGKDDKKESSSERKKREKGS